MVRFFLICLLIHLPLFASPQKNLAQHILSTIPAEELTVLEEFFRELLFAHGFAYTLFGDKPISIENYDRDHPEKPDVFATSCKGYKVWEKYAPLFPQRHYIFLFYEDPISDTYEITLINKQAFLQTTSRYGGKFLNTLTPTPEKLLDLLIQNHSLENTSIRVREDLIGILLGYGENNAALFHRRHEITHRTRNLKKKNTKPSPGYCSTDEECAALNARLQAFSTEKRKSLNYMRLPGFVADPNHPETIQLKKKYIEQRKQITQRFSRRSVLEVVFEQLDQ
jgi:hypothetical protein